MKSVVGFSRICGVWFRIQIYVELMEGRYVEVTGAIIDGLAGARDATNNASP